MELPESPLTVFQRESVSSYVFVQAPSALLSMPGEEPLQILSSGLMTSVFVPLYRVVTVRSHHP